MITPVVQFFSDPLRLTLLVVGIIVLIVVYFISRRPKLSKTALAEENKAVHPSQYQDLPEERGGVGKVSVRKAADEEKVKPKPKSSLKTFQKEEEKAVPPPPAMLLDDEVEGVGAVTVKPTSDNTAKPEQTPASEKTTVPTPETKEGPVKTEEEAAPATVKAEPTTKQPKVEEPPRVTERVTLSREKSKKAIVVLLEAEEGRTFGGRIFASAMAEVGLELGDRGIFHNHAKDQNRDYINFSVANIKEPGEFDLSNIDEFKTNGLSFFMQVPMEIGNASLAFTQMMSAAQRLSRRLGGKLYTEDHKPLNVAEINVMRIEVEKYM